MRWLLFLSRLAFICGVFLLLSFSLLIRDWAQDDAITSTLITIGYIMGLVVLPVVNLSYLVVLFVKRRITIYVPLWLVISNILFLFILIFYIFYLNDPYYHQK
jgi:hypothetical protein